MVSPPDYIAGTMRVKVGPTTAYSWWLHFGRRPGKPPPVQNIIDWVREKHISGTYGSTGRRLGGYKRQAVEDKAAAFAIAKAIGRRGTPPFPFLTVAFHMSRREAINVFTRVLLRGVFNA
jgi:hypothetical protein